MGSWLFYPQLKTTEKKYACLCGWQNNICNKIIEDLGIKVLWSIKSKTLLLTIENCLALTKTKLRNKIFRVGNQCQWRIRFTIYKSLSYGLGRLHWSCIFWKNHDWESWPYMQCVEIWSHWKNFNSISISLISMAWKYHSSIQRYDQHAVTVENLINSPLSEKRDSCKISSNRFLPMAYKSVRFLYSGKV